MAALEKFQSVLFVFKHVFVMLMLPREIKGYASAFFAPSLSNSSVDRVATGCRNADILLSKLRQYSDSSPLEILAVGGDPLTCIIPHLFGISSSFGYSQ